MNWPFLFYSSYTGVVLQTAACLIDIYSGKTRVPVPASPLELIPHAAVKQTKPNVHGSVKKAGVELHWLILEMSGTVSFQKSLATMTLSLLKIRC